MQTHFDAAHTFQLAGDLSHAESEYRQMLGLALRQIGNFRANHNDFAGADEVFTTALALQTDDADLHVDYAILHLRRERFPEARREAEAAVTIAPENARAQQVLGKTFFALGELDGAIQHLEKAAALAPDFEVAYTLGSAYLRHKEPGKAQAVFDEMLATGGPSAAPRLHALFAFSYHAAAEPDQAVAQFQKALALDPKLPQAHYYLGLDSLTRLDESGFPQAKNEFELEIQNHPGDFASQYLLGYILMQEHEQTGAELHLLAAAKIDPVRPDPYIYLGQLYTDTNRPADVERVLRQAIKLATDVAHNNYQISRAHYLLGRLLTEQGHRKEAAQELGEYARLRNLAVEEVRDARDRPAETKAAAQAGDAVQQVLAAGSLTAGKEADKASRAYMDGLGGEVADAFNNLGVIAAQRNEFPKALEHFRHSAQWSPEPENLQRNWGMAAFLAGRYDEAIPALEKHLARNKGDTRAQARLAMSYFVTEKYPQSVKACQPIATQVASDAALAYACGVSLVKTGEVPEGIKLLKQVDAASPNSSDAHVLLGQAYADQGDTEQAISEFQRALQLAPERKQIHFQYGLLMLKKGRLAEAQEQFREELKLDPSNPSARYHLAVSLLQDQNKEEAAKLLHDLIQDDPTNADAHYQMGKLEIDRDEIPNAVSDLETAAKLAPEQSYIHYQLGIAYRRSGNSPQAAQELKLYERLKARNRGRTDVPAQ